MVKRRAPRVLFFTGAAMPTDEEYALAEQLGGNVGFRNGKIAARNTKPEACDAVAAVKGKFIPAVYAQYEIPRVKSAADVARIKPSFKRDIGYTDDEDEDQIEAVAAPTEEPTVDPGTPVDVTGEPAAGGDADADKPAPRRRGGKAAQQPAQPPEPVVASPEPPTAPAASPEQATAVPEQPSAPAAALPWGTPPTTGN